jgi:hypothetical protein
VQALRYWFIGFVAKEGTNCPLRSEPPKCYVVWPMPNRSPNSKTTPRKRSSNVANVRVAIWLGRVRFSDCPRDAGQRISVPAE